MNPAGGKTKPAKKVGAKMKDDAEETDAKKLANRLRQRKFKENQGKQIGGVVDDLDNCDEEREELKVEKKELQDKVSNLTTLLKNCDAQVADILKSVNSMKNMKKGSPSPQGGAKAKPRKKPTTALQKEAGSVLTSAMRGALVRSYWDNP